MRRTIRILIWLICLLFALPVLAMGVVLLALNTDPGRRLAERQIAGLTGGMVVADGIGGRFPDALRLRHLEVHDEAGPWLLADDVALDWSPLALLQREAHVERLAAARLQLARLPQSNPGPAAPSAPSKPFQLPVRVVADRIHIARAEIGAPVMGAPAVLSADGHADLPSLETGTAMLVLDRLDGAGHYALDGHVDADALRVTLNVSEPAGGLIAHVASLPDIGALSVNAVLDGPRRAIGTALSVSAGPLRATAKGTVDLVGQAMALDVSATAPAMTPAPDVTWQSVQVQASVHGPFTTPDASGQVRIAGLAVLGASLRQLTADLGGNEGEVHLHAVADGLQVPGPQPALLAGGPLVLDSSARLDDPSRPVRFTLSHPLIEATGQARTGATRDFDADLRLPDLTPLAAMGGVALQGGSALHLRAAMQGATTTVDADGTIDVTGGLAPIPGMIGQARLGLSGQTTGEQLVLSRLTVTGRALDLSATGSRGADGRLAAQAHVALSDLAVVAPTLSGAVALDAQVQGPTNRLTVNGILAGEVGAPGVPRGPVRLTVALQDLPAAPTGTVAASGSFAGAPVELLVKADRQADGTLRASIDRADWRSLHAEGEVRLPPGATLPLGRVALRVPHLDDLRPLVGQPLAGGMTAAVELDAHEARLTAEAQAAGMGANRVGHATVTARVAEPATRPVVTASAVLDGIAAAGATGSAKLDVSGPQDALALRTSAALRVSDTGVAITAAALLNGVAKQLRLDSLQMTARDQTVRLLAPATLRFADGVLVDRLRIGLQSAVLEVAGSLSPKLDAKITLRTPADVAAIAGPDYAADGTVALDAQLSGTPARPGGTIRLSAAGLHMRSGTGRALPPAALTATAQLAGTSARIDARLDVGRAQLAVNGTAPLGAGPLALRATGAVDLALLDPILGAGGRRARGRLSLDASVTGTASAPRASGTAQLAGGEIQDFTQGFRLFDLAATLRADGDTLRIASLTGRAGPGTVSASGSIGILAPGLPVDIALTLRNARPLASDRLTAEVDGDLTVKGQAAGSLQAGGSVLVRRAEIRIPETLPASVAVLDVRRPGERPPAPAYGGTVALDLTIRAPGPIFVRGRGVDAELAGDLRIRGTSAAPQVGGGLEMRRGTISVAGTTLQFTRGKVGFDGTGVTGKIDPTLDFVAESTAGSVTATLTIGGYASAPKITLSSVPDLPQDEVLAYLIFKRSAKELGPFQIAEIAAALANLTGVGGGGVNPLESVRRGLGLDRLSLGAGAGSSSAPSVEAGRYVANGVYVGAKQGTTGGQTGATVQIDITKGLKLETDVGTGTGGNQVGVTYQFEY